MSDWRCSYCHLVWAECKCGTPKRIQLSRKAGWRKPEGAVVCSRPGRWGNPHTVERNESDGGGPWLVMCDGVMLDHGSRDDMVSVAVMGFASDLRDGLLKFKVEDVRRELRGKDLCCWCRLCPAHRDGKPWDVKCAECAPCHVDVLLQIAAQD